MSIYIMDAYKYVERQSKPPIPLLNVSLSFFKKEKKLQRTCLSVKSL